MGRINILDLEPTSINSSLKGKYILIYGAEKMGKTTFLTRNTDCLLLAFEKGYNAKSGIYAQDINSWSDLKQVLRQLNNPAAMERYKTLGIDTVGIMWSMCEKYVCETYGVKNLGDVPWGQGWTRAKKEFSDALSTMVDLGYGVLIAAHSVEGEVTVPNPRFVEGTDSPETITIKTAKPDIQKSAMNIVNRLVDIIGYVDVRFDDPLKPYESRRILYTKQNPYIKAGSRWGSLPAEIPFGYKELEEAIGKALEEEANKGAVVEEKGIEIVDKTEIEEEKEDRAIKLKQEGADLWQQKILNSPENQAEITKFITDLFGENIKLSAVPVSQVDLLEIAIKHLREM